MQQKKFGTRSGFSVPDVSIGAMRVPQDLDRTVELIRHAIDSGMRYIDTSRGYGESEWLLGKALKDGYREKVILSTKWAPWIKKILPEDAPTADSVRRRIDESMKRLDVDYLDFYQTWNIHSRECYDKTIAKNGMLDGILKAKEEGLIGHTGFTTHDSVENVLTYIEEADWCEIILFTYNILNPTYASAIKAAHEKGIGTLVMNPVGGGKLAQHSPVFEPLIQEMDATSLADLSVRYVLSNPNVDTILCGMTKADDVDATIASAEREQFTDARRRRIESFVHELTPERAGFCTRCNYCMPCPQGIDIPRIMSCVHEAQYFGFVDSARKQYQGINGPKADACTACKKCENACTQGLPISDLMRYADQTLGTH